MQTALSLPGASLTVCIVNWNTRNDLRTCLQSLHDFPPRVLPLRVVVVDNASEDGSADMVRDEFGWVTLVANPANRNYAAATNQVFALVRADPSAAYVLLLNPDVRILSGTIRTLINAALDRPEVLAFAARLLNKDSTTQPSVRGFPTPNALLADIFSPLPLPFLKRDRGLYRQTEFHYDIAQPAPQPMASCFLLTRRALELVGDMDERFPLYFNDVDWCWRAWQADPQDAIWYIPEAAVCHGHGGTTKSKGNALRRVTVWESHRALLRFYKKHYRRDTPVLVYYLLTLLITVGAWVRTGRWGRLLGRHGGETTPESLHRELEYAGRSSCLPAKPANGDG